MKTKLWLSMVAAVALAGCGASVRATKAPGVSLTQYHTFAFYQPPPTSKNQIAFEGSPAGQAVRNQIAQDLQQKGLVEVQPGQPADFLIAFHARLQPRYEVTDWGYGPGWGWGWGWGGWYGEPMVTEYTEGTLIVDFLDPRTHQVIWRGTASQVVNHPHNPNPTKIAKAVNKLMKKYPAQLATANIPGRM